MLALAKGEKQSTVVGNSFSVSLNVLKLVVFFSNFVQTSFIKYMEGMIKQKDRIHFSSSKKLYEVFACFAIVIWLESMFQTIQYNFGSKIDLFVKLK